MISKASAKIELWILWFRVQSLKFRVGSSFAAAMVSLILLYLSAPLLSLFFCSFSVSAAVDTWWERNWESTIDERINTELQLQLVNFKEQVDLRAAQMAAAAVLQKEHGISESDEEIEEEDPNDYEYEFPAKREGHFPNPATGSGAVAVAEHGWKNKNWNGKGSDDDGKERVGSDPEDESGSGEDDGRD